MRILLIALSTLALLVGWAAAEVPTTMNYQGQLNDSEGNPVVDGNYSVTFSLYDVPSGGTDIWTENRTIETANGLFSIILGAINPITSVMVESAPRYLGITVEGDPEQLPRVELTSVPFALTAMSTSISIPAGPQADTLWLCPYFGSRKVTTTTYHQTRIYFLNPNDVSADVTLTFYDGLGNMIDQCVLQCGANRIRVWNSTGPSVCQNAAPDDSWVQGWFKLQSDQPIMPWGFYSENTDLSGGYGVAFSAALTFYTR
jgi:hypothetical protein